MHELETFHENETYKILWNFEKQKDHPIPTRRPGLLLTGKENQPCHLVDFTIPVDHRVKMKASNRIDKYLDLDKEQKKNKKTVEHEVESDINWNSPQRPGKTTGGMGNQRKNQDDPVYSVVNIG